MQYTLLLFQYSMKFDRTYLRLSLLYVENLLKRFSLTSNIERKELLLSIRKDLTRDFRIDESFLVVIRTFDSHQRSTDHSFLKQYSKQLFVRLDRVYL